MLAVLTDFDDEQRSRAGHPDETITGGIITDLVKEGDNLRIDYWSGQRMRLLSLVFHRVEDVEARRVEGWSFASVIVEPTEFSWRRYSFSSGVEPLDDPIQFATPRGSMLVIVARDMTLEPSRVSRLRGYWRMNEAQRRDQGLAYWGLLLTVLGIFAAMIGSLALLLLAMSVWIRGLMEVMNITAV